MNTRKNFGYGIFAVIMLLVCALSLTGCPPEPDEPGFEEPDPNEPGTPGLEYQLNSSGTGYYVSKGTVTDGKVVIPATYNDLPVTNIGDNAFKSCTGITSVIIHSNVTYIGDSAFYGCTGITKITIATGLERIGSYAFAFCRSITSINIPSSVTAIGRAAFRDCTGITSITIPASVTWVDSFAFAYWTSRQTINVPWSSGNRPAGWSHNWDDDVSFAKIVYKK